MNADVVEGREKAGETISYFDEVADTFVWTESKMTDIVWNVFR